MAFAALGIGAAIVVCLAVFSVCAAQIQCGDAAYEIARQAARDDLAGVSQVEARLPDSAHVAVDQDGNQVVVHVSWEVRLLGWLPEITVQATSSVVREGGAR